ncbi:MAG: hypothetical protein ACLQC7_08855 [Thermoplasmata archaeon]
MKKGNGKQIVAVAFLVAILLAGGLTIAVSGTASTALRIASSPGTTASSSISSPAAAAGPVGSGGSTAVPSGPASSPNPATGPCSVSVTGENLAGNAVQTAINAAVAIDGTVVCIGPGTYPEQLTISTGGITLVGAGDTSTIIEPNAPLAFNTYDYDAPGGPTSVPAAAIILVQGFSGDPTTGVTGVTIENLQVNGAAATSTFTGCGPDYFGVDFQASSGTLTNAIVANVAMPTADFGCQSGIGVYAYNAYFNYEGTNHAPDTVAISASTITGYQKGGVVCDDLQETCSLSTAVVTGVGATALTAQNGIQIAYGASGTVTGSTVTGDHYTGGVAKNADYFLPIYTATGILVYDGGNTIVITGNVLSGNDLGIALLGTPVATVSTNAIHQGFSYGITFDLNASLNWLYLPIYSTDTPWITTAAGNTIANVNVGMLIYDDNVTITGGSMTNVNVSIESMLDQNSPYAIVISSFSAQANVDGALLGNISGYQSTSGFYPKPVGTYTLTGDSFTALGPGAGKFGVVLNGTSASMTGGSVTGFAVGIQMGYVFPAVAVEPTGTYLASYITVTGPGSAGPPGEGIAVFGGSVTVSSNTVSAYSYETTTTRGGNTYSSWFENTQSIGIFAGCAEGSATCNIGSNFLNDNSIGIVYALMTSGFQGITPAAATIDFNEINDSLAYGLLVEATGAPGTTLVAINYIDNSASGAPAVFLDGTTVDVLSNIFIGTSTSGSNGAYQGEDGCASSIATASVEASDCFNPATEVTMNGNFFEETTVFWSSTFPSHPSGSYLQGGEMVSFTETGLPSGTAWTVSFPVYLHGPGWVLTLSLTTFSMDLANASYLYTASSANPDYVSPGGLFIVSGTALAETVAFSFVTSQVTFSETGLQFSRSWSVAFDGILKTTTGPSIVFTGVANGAYPYLIRGPTHQQVSGLAPYGTISVSGANVVESVTLVSGSTVRLTFHEAGLVSGTLWCVTIALKVCSTRTTVVFGSLTPATYSYAIGPFAGMTTLMKLSGVWTVQSSGTAAIGATTTYQVRFTFPISFEETGLTGTFTWSVTSMGERGSSSTSTIVLYLPVGSHAFTVHPVPGYQATPSSGHVTVAGSPPPVQRITFTLSVHGLVPGAVGGTVGPEMARATEGARVA